MLRLVNTAEQASACLPIGTFLLPLYVNLIGSSGGVGRLVALLRLALVMGGELVVQAPGSHLQDQQFFYKSR